MRLVTVLASRGCEGGVLAGDGSIVPLKRWGLDSVEDLISAGPSAWETVERESLGALSEWPREQRLASPVMTIPRNMFCIGLNYMSHYDEGQRHGEPMPESPIIFTKAWTTLIGPRDDIVVDRSATEKVDWEAELAVVIGTGGLDIPEDQAVSHVFGYCLANDVSARDLQQANGRFSQWHKGKSLDGFCPLGPSLVSASELSDLSGIRIELYVNGVRKQDIWPKDMYHPIPRLISYLSMGMALLPGDVILTGTGSGVGLWQEPPEFLHEGDVVEIRSDVLGVLRNRVVDRRE